MQLNALTLLMKAGNIFTPTSPSSSPFWHQSIFLNRNYQQTWLKKLPSHNFYCNLQLIVLCPAAVWQHQKKTKKKRFDFHLKQNAPLSPSVRCMSSALASPSDWCDSVSPACCTPASPCVFPQRPLDPMQSGPQRWAWTCLTRQPLARQQMTVWEVNTTPMGSAEVDGPRRHEWMTVAAVRWQGLTTAQTETPLSVDLLATQGGCIFAKLNYVM